MAARHVLVLALATLLAGCFGGTAPPQDSESPSDAWAPAGLVTPTFAAPALVGESTNGAEPNVHVAPDGAVYVAAGLLLWRSEDSGQTFAALGASGCDTPRYAGTPACPPGFEGRFPGIVGPGDGDLASLADGTLLWTGLNDPSGVSVPFQTSRDRGETWSEPLDLAEGAAADRQWLTVDATGTVHVTWRHIPNAASGAVVLRQSLDGGASWSPPQPVAPDGWNGPVAPSPDGRNLYVPYEQEGLRISRSADGGATWDSVTITESPPSPPVQNGGPLWVFPVAAVDHAGNVFVVWSEDDMWRTTGGVKAADVPRVYFSASADRGASWTGPTMLSAPGHAAVMPWIVAGAAGRVSVAWYENARGLPNEFVPDEWTVVLAQTVDAAGESPTWASAAVSSDPVHLGGVCSDGGACTITGRDRSLLDFFEIDLLPSGLPILAFGSDGDTTSRVRTTIQVGVVADGTVLQAPRP